MDGWIYVLLDAGCVLLLLLLILVAVMCWRWRTQKDPLPQRVRTVYNKTFRRKGNDGNDVAAHPIPMPMSNVAELNNSRPSVITCVFISHRHIIVTAAVLLLFVICALTFRNKIIAHIV